MEEAATGAVEREGAPNSLARYLAQIFVAKRGYQPGTVAEAAELLSACDAVLTKADGVSLRIVCLIDGESRPERRFEVPKARLQEIAKVCQAKYVSPVYGGTRVAVGIEVIEVRRPTADAGLRPDADRLAALRGANLTSAIASYLVDAASRTVTGGSGALLDLGFERRALEKLAREPRLSGAELVPPPRPQAPVERGRPWLTYAMLALFTGIFLIELFLPGHPPSDFTPDITTLVALGGVSRSLVEQPGEWYRLFTAALLHASPLHLIFNGIAFWIGGVFLESLVGPAWLFAIFGLGALGGSAMSLALNEPNVVSVGASGAIMAMLSAGLVTTRRIPHEAGRARIQGGLLRMLIPSLLPFMSVHSGEKIDYADHFGGALAGLAVGVLILATWPEASEIDGTPARAGLAKLLAVACAALFLFGGVRVAQLYSEYMVGSQLIPEDELPQGQAAVVAQAPALLAKYPKDPRSHLFKAIALGAQDQNTAAEAELRLALANPELLKTHFDVDLEIVIRNLLAVSLLEQHRIADAKEAVRPVCGAGPDGGVPKDLADLKLCGG
jgi:rhomboid protease GluP